MRIHCALAFLAIPLSLSGCLTFSGDQLAEVPVEPGTTRPAIQHTVGDFRFDLEGGALASGNQIGRNINQEIFDRWRESGWISQHHFVQSSQFSDEYPLRLTLSGQQRGESSAVMSAISGATLLLIPHSVDSKMRLQFTLENAQTGCVFEATAAESYNTVISLLLIPALPFSQIGAGRSYAHLADHLYSQLAAQGAFGEHTPCGSDPNEFSVEAHARKLEKKLADGLISRSEYEDQSHQPFFATGDSADPACSLLLLSSDAQTEARFGIRTSQAGMIPGVLRCASTVSSASIDSAAVELCTNGRRYATLAASLAIERVRTPSGIPIGFIAGVQAGMKQARERDVQAAFLEGQYGPAELGPAQEAEGFVFFDVPGGAISGPSGATLQVRDASTGDARALHLGDTSSCAGR